MTDFMTALHLILVQLTCPGEQRVGNVKSKGCFWHQKGLQFQLTCNLCRESHKTQVWLCFLVVSFLSIATCAASGTDTRHFQSCLEQLREKNKPVLQKSDAMLYAPSVDEIENNCEDVSLKCYVEELKMVLDEEEIKDKAECIFHFNESLAPHSDGCPACETYPLKNITIFLERLETLLKKMTAQSTL